MKKPIEILREARDQINQAIDKLEERPHVNRIDYNREYELGTRYILPDRTVFQYGELDFGIIARNNDGGEIRNIQYRWIRTR